MRARVAIVGPTYPLRGGQALLLGHVYEALRRRGAEVRVITFKRLYPRLLFPGKRQHNISAQPVKRLPSAPILTPTNPWTWRQALQLLGEDDRATPQVLLMTWWNPFFGPMFRWIARAALRRHGIPTLMICENIVSHEARRVDGLLTRMGLAEPREFVVLSAAVAEDLRQYRTKALVHKSSLPIYDCYGGPTNRSAARTRLGIREERVVLFFGLVRAYKGLDLLIDAMASVHREVAGVRLLVVGEFYEGEVERRAQVKALGTEAHTTFIAEYVPDEDVATYFSAADCVVLPYRSATQSGITQVAIGMGVPMIATRVGGLPEVVEPGVNGLLVPAEDVGALAQAILQFFQEDLGKALRRQMAERRDDSPRSEDEIAAIIEDFARRHAADSVSANQEVG